MLLERAELVIREGMEEKFAAAMRAEGVPLLLGVPGVNSVKMGRGVEHPNRFMLLVHWDSMQAHGAFGASPASKALRAVISPFSIGGAMEHFEFD